MDILLQELYKIDISSDKFHSRKVHLDNKSYQINGITQSGKTKLVKNFLLSLKKTSYLYIDCSDIRIVIDELNNSLAKFCNLNKINTLVLDNYTSAIKIPNVPQLIICSQVHHDITYLESVWLYPLDYEEFLAFEYKYDSTALNHFIQLGGFASMHKILSDERNIYIQKTLQYALDNVEFDILVLCAKMMAQKLSPFSIYERLKQSRKISKDKLYISFDSLVEKRYIHLLAKNEHPKATKKIYLCDISLKSALSLDKNFSRLFENMVYLELLKSGITCFYDDGVDFYIPSRDEIILCKPFGDERSLFKKMQLLESFIFSYKIKKVTTITMNTEGSLSHPLSKVEMLPFDIWALGDL
ncbi:ATPase [Sulfurimonas hongkongensis]|uniref:ATPase n=1 Tax=Sulfurimonas hongkongensis TaxID=1172190 RepID=T0JMH2_9BACT|nr:ATP-binding protein [Sulfurimonas hongkongensis]EQB39286.1 ATPase [Sulfurimonas hongkongensis]